MTNQEIARLLRQIAAAYLLKQENRFKIIAYERAAETIQKSNIEVKDLWEAGKLSSLAGIGRAISSHLDELFRTGRVKHFNQVLTGLPKALFPLLDIPGFGPKKAYKLVSELKLVNPHTVINDLLGAARKGKIAPIAGFGDKSQQYIIEALQRFKQGQTKERRMPLPYAYNIATNIISYLKQHQSVVRAIPLGSLRRMVATIGDIDIAVASKNPEKVIDWFLEYPKIKKILEKGSSGASILLENGQQIDLRVQSPDNFGAMLQYFTGSKNHNIHLREFALKKGLSLSEYGIKLLKRSQKSTHSASSGREVKSQKYNEKLKIFEFASEKDFYHALGLPWIPPELREDSGEIEAALRQASYDKHHNGQDKYPGLPKLVELQDIKGDLHIHSDYNLLPSHDLGESSLKEILDQAVKLGYQYIGLSDHNPSYTNHTSYRIIDILKRRRYYFEQNLKSTKSTRVNLFIMLEVDILSNGQLAIPEKAFEYLDAVIVSVHSSFAMSKEKMTRRIINGLNHSKAKILAHPTGRLIGKREAYEIDIDKLFSYCCENKKALEINAYPDRLDMPDTLVHEAIKKGVKFVIGTDSHKAQQMDLMKYGISVARRGWAQSSDILTTLPYNKIKTWLSGEEVK